MKTKITQTNSNELLVNNKRIYRDVDGTWQTKETFSTKEELAFRNHIAKPHAHIRYKLPR